MNDNSQNILKPIPYDEAKYFVNARQKTYLTSTEIYIPTKPYEKTKPYLEPTIKNKRSSSASSIPTSEEEKLERSTRRAFTSIKDIALSNPFEMFVTFTFKARRDEAELCKSKMSGWLKRQRKIDKSFQYIIVAEFHKDGVSLHFHALIKGYKGKIVRAINPKTGKPLVKKHKKVYDFPNYTLGHCEVYYIGDTDEDRITSGFYLLKYVKKEMPVFANKKRYWSSRGLKLPLTIDNPEEWYFAVTPDHMIPTEYGQFLYFDNKRIEIFLP